ncbi:MAG: hypothetical protein M0R17_07245 [Candidatus Omnitrophica bacterium]|jgi:hypothetical protein|nr:hypothetical protein [Candidatus Omnitrophota bacterium]
MSKEAIRYDGNFPTNELDLETYVVGGKEYVVTAFEGLGVRRDFFPWKKEHFTKPLKDGAKEAPSKSGIFHLAMELEIRRNVGLNDVKYYKDRWIKATSGGAPVMVKSPNSEDYEQLYVHYQAVFDCWAMNDENKVQNYKMGYYVDISKPPSTQPETIVKQIFFAMEKYAKDYPYLVFTQTARRPKKGTFPYSVLYFGQYEDRNGNRSMGVPKAIIDRLPRGSAPITFDDAGLFPSAPTKSENVITSDEDADMLEQ